MKKITLFISTLFLWVMVTNAAVTLPLDYTKFFAATAVNANGTDLETTGTSQYTWFVGPTVNGSSPTISNTGLLSFPGYIDNTNGKKIALLSTISGTRTTFFNLAQSGTDLTLGTYYLGFLLKVTSAPASYALLLNFTNAISSNNARGRVQIKDNGSATGFKLQPLTYNVGGTATTDIKYNDIHFIVIKYQITTVSSPAGTANGAATTTIYVDPTPGNTEPNSTYLSTQSGVTNLDCLKSLVLNQQPLLGAEISGLRFATSWSDVCKAASIPKLATPTTNPAGSVSSTGFTANWNAVSNAQSYTLAIYQNGVPVGSNITGISGTSYTVSGLNNFSTYTYKVTAVGDGSSYSNSDPSTAQNVTTLDPNAVNSLNVNFADGSWTALTGTYSDVSANGFDFIKTRLTTANYYGSKGELHTKYVDIDNKTNGGKMTLPTVNSLSQIEIHAVTGTAERTFDLKEYNAITGAYDLLATYTYNTLSKNSGLDSVYIINISRSAPTKLRIENSGYGGMSVMQVITRTTALSSLSSPAASVPAQVTNTGFTASWSQVANATGYEIRVFQGTAVRKAITVGDGATTTTDITGLTPNTGYFYKVAAVADGTNYLNSFLSPSGGSFTTANEFSVSSATSSSALTTLNTESVITVQQGNTFTVNTNANVNNIILQAGARLTLNSANTLSVTNGITLQNTASGTASFVDERTADNPTAITGTVEQAITETNRNWYVAIPVSGKTASDITLSGAKIVQRNEAESRWDDVLSGAGLTPGIGYIAVASANSGTTSWSLNGNLNSGKVEVPVTRSGATSAGFNLLGNPYPSYLNWEQVLSLNPTNEALLQPSIWYRTKTGAGYVFQTYNSAGRIATPTTTSGYIPPMQAFWVRANNAGLVTFTNAMRSHGDGSGNLLKAPGFNLQKIIRLQLSNETSSDETVVYFDENAQNIFDKYDTEKMFNNVSSKPELYTMANNEKLVINGLAGVTDQPELPVGITYQQGGNLKLKITGLSNFDSNTRIWLLDKQENKQTELTPETEYTFSITATTGNESRFSLLFKAPGATTGNVNAESNQVSVFVNAQSEIVINAVAGSRYSVYNTAGQQMAAGKTVSAFETINQQLNNGVYVVKVGSVSKRVIVK